MIRKNPPWGTPLLLALGLVVIPAGRANAFLSSFDAHETDPTPTDQGSTSNGDPNVDTNATQDPTGGNSCGVGCGNNACNSCGAQNPQGSSCGGSSCGGSSCGGSSCGGSGCGGASCGGASCGGASCAAGCGAGCGG
ncbi:MAG TPA: hypothetical protein VFF73_06495 [Planctomycetota bacterium]|nr:hypothetical protein [Planctomycetota bacterium]